MACKKLLAVTLVTAAAILGVPANGISIARASGLEATPLAPPDLSSPRATLQGFLDEMTALFVALESVDNQKVTLLLPRIWQMLDFSATPGGHKWDERDLRALYLKEILDRVDLPAIDDVPGDAEMARWTVPNTRINITRIEQGERAGEFVFSAGTVSRLDSYYRRMKHLPYRPGSTVGFLERVNTYERTTETLADRIESRLKPVDATSPRQVVQEFLVSVNGAHALMREADEAFRATPPTMTRLDALESERRATAFMDRAIQMLDLSQVPRARRRNIGVERTLQIKEVLDRAPLPEIGAIPGERQLVALKSAGSKAPIRWFFPHTQLEIVEVTEGPRVGQFKFSAQTVSLADDYYERVRDLPYRGEANQRGLDLANADDYVSPEVSAGIYEAYVSTPGYLIPGASRLGALLVDVPTWLTPRFLNQTLWQWIGIALVLAVTVAAFTLVRTGCRLVSRRVASPWAEWIKILIPLLNAIVVVKMVDFIDVELNATGAVAATVLIMGHGLMFLILAVAVFRSSVAVGETIVVVRPIATQGFDASLVRVISRSAGFLIGVVVLFNGLSSLGLDVVPLLAGLGFGGLAVALAVRPTLENMIGGLILFADRPIRIGDFCTFGGQSGTVEGIGLRSTRVRALDRTLITVPNAAFADLQLVNWSACEKMLITTVIGLRYETTAEQMRNVLARMRHVCIAHPKIEAETARVRFTAFGASSRDVTVRVYALTNDWNEFHAIREDLFLRFAEAIEESGTSVAFPSSTLYLGRDDGLDPEKIKTAEREVAAWRQAGELPFPHTPASLAARITDTLDYPPAGSPEAEGKEAAEENAEPLAGPDELEAELEAKTDEEKEEESIPRR